MRPIEVVAGRERLYLNVAEDVALIIREAAARSGYTMEAIVEDAVRTRYADKQLHLKTAVQYAEEILQMPEAEQDKLKLGRRWDTDLICQSLKVPNHVGRLINKYLRKKEEDEVMAPLRRMRGEG